MFNHLTRWRRCVAMAALALQAVWAPQAGAQTARLDVYVDPQGSDLNSGLSDQAPVLTLARAQEVASTAYQAGVHASITVKVAAGTYSGQSVLWTFVPGVVPLTIQGPSAVDKPVFDGAGTAKTFLTIRYSKEPSNVTVRNLFITQYLTSAIQLRGASQVNVGAAGSLIESNVFDKIGSKWVFNGEASYAALSLWMTHNNVVRNNVFNRIADFNPNSVGLHAIYAAHWSTDNEISGNTFSNIAAGDVVKFRNRSNHNQVLNNSFVNNRNWSAVYNWVQWSAPYDGECPNHHITVSGNRVVMGSDSPNGVYDPSKALFKNYVFARPDKTYGCPEDEIDDYLQNPRTEVGVDLRQGCLVSVNSCPRMNRADRFEFADTDADAHGSETACLARAKDWFSSCSRYSAGTPQMARTRFLMETSQAGDRVTAHGCVVTANTCPYMGFLPQESKLDTKATSHSSSTECLARTSAYYSSCSKKLTADELQNLKIRVQYFQFGNLVAERTEP